MNKQLVCVQTSSPPENPDLFFDFQGERTSACRLQASKQASRQAGKQASRQAGKQASKIIKCWGKWGNSLINKVKDDHIVKRTRQGNKYEACAHVFYLPSSSTAFSRWHFSNTTHNSLSEYYRKWERKMSDPMLYSFPPAVYQQNKCFTLVLSRFLVEWKTESSPECHWNCLSGLAYMALAYCLLLCLSSSLSVLVFVDFFAVSVSFFSASVFCAFWCTSSPCAWGVCRRCTQGGMQANSCKN